MDETQDDDEQQPPATLESMTAETLDTLARRRVAFAEEDSSASEAESSASSSAVAAPRLLRAARPPHRERSVFDDEYSAKAEYWQRHDARERLVKLESRKVAAPTFGEERGPRFRQPTTKAGEHRRAYGVGAWLSECRAVRARQARRAEARARESHLVAVGFYQHLVLRRWRRVAKTTKVWRRLLYRCGVGKGWKAWRDWLQSMRKLEELGARVAYLLRRRFPAGRAFEAWRRAAAFLAKAAFLRGVVARCLNRALGAAFNHWRAALDELRKLGKRLEKVARTWHRASTLGAYWSAWQRRTLLAAFLERALKRWTRGALARGWEAWRLVKKRAVEDDLKASDATNDVLNALFEGARARCLRRAWASWRLLPAPPEAPAAPSPRGRPRRQRADPRRGRCGHCKCVYEVSAGGHCACSRGDHLRWRVAALRKNVDASLNAGDAALPPPKRHTERPPRPAAAHAAPAGRFHGTLDTAAADPQRRWDEARAAARAAAAAKENAATARARSRRGPPRADDDLRLMRTPTVARMSVDALYGGGARPRRARTAAHSFSRW